MVSSPTGTSDALAALIDTYHEFENRITVREAPADGSLKSLVTFDTAKASPIHRWYSFKEGYSDQLLGWLQKQEIMPAGKTLRLLDPFCGVATTLLSSQLSLHKEHIATAMGIERNPAIRFIADAKLHWKTYDSVRI